MTITVTINTPDHCAAKVTTNHIHVANTVNIHTNTLIVPPSTERFMFHIWDGVDAKIEELSLEAFNELKNEDVS